MERTRFEPSRQPVPLACSTIPEEVADQEQAQDRFGINRRAPGLAMKALKPVPPAGSGITGGQRRRALGARRPLRALRLGERLGHEPNTAQPMDLERSYQGLKRGHAIMQMRLMRHTVSVHTGARRSVSATFTTTTRRLRRHLLVLVAWQLSCTLARIFLEGTMSQCVCGHPEEAHLFGGRCRVPGCMCDRFWPIPEISDGALGSSARSSPLADDRRRLPQSRSPREQQYWPELWAASQRDC